MGRIVRKVVIAAAGQGTRLQPITSVLPKEILPVVDRPVFQYVLEEAIAPGIEEVILVIKPKKRILLDYINSSSSLEFKQLIRQVKLTVVYQLDTSYGTGAALMAAKPYLKDEPFLMLFADSFSPKQFQRIPGLITAYLKYQQPVISLMIVSAPDTYTYGIVQVKPVKGNLVRIERFWEKPGPKILPPPFYAAPNGYILTSDIFSLIGLDQSGELDVNIASYCQERLVYGVVFDGPYFEVGNRTDLIKSTGKMPFYRSDLTNIQLEIRSFMKKLAHKSESSRNLSSRITK